MSDKERELVVKSGEHLAAVRTWIQWNARNGEQVTWGSEDVLQGEFTVAQLERLAQTIANLWEKKHQNRIRVLHNQITELENVRDHMAPFFQPDIRRGPAHSDWLEAAEVYLSTNPIDDSATDIRELYNVGQQEGN